MTDPTPMLYACYKGRLVTIFRRIVQLTLGRQILSYEDTMKLDRMLYETHGEVPPSLRMRPLSLSFTDQPSIILNRLYIDSVFLISCCVLHRRYLTYDRLNAAFEYSRKCCTDAALKLLRHQVELNAACQPGAQFSEEKTMISSLMLHDFLVAAMVICVDLYESRNRSPISLLDSDAQAEKYDALVISHRIWMSRRSSSRDARKACNVYAFILARVSRSCTEDISTRRNSDQSKVTHKTPESSTFESNGFNNGLQASDKDRQTLSPRPYDPWKTIVNGSDDIDWVSLTGFTAHLCRLNHFQGLIDHNMLGAMDFDDASSIDWQLLDSMGTPLGFEPS